MQNDANDKAAREPLEDYEGSSVRTYVLIGIVLAIVTVVEVQIPTWLAGQQAALVTGLLVSAFFKAGLVALFYMHLKGDSRVYSGIVALSLLLITFFLVMLTFGQIRL